MGKILTVSIAAYNVENYIKNALNTFANSKYNDYLEVFIIDDGGTDETLNIAKHYAKKYPQIFIPVHKENGGWGSTVNYGIEHAHGKYFKQLDGDDKFIENGFDEYLDLLINNEADLIYTPYILYDNAQNKIIKEIGIAEFPPLRKLLSFEEWPEDADVAMHSCTFKTSILKNNNVQITEKCFYTDVEYVLKACSYVNTICFSDSPVYWYRVNREGQSMSYTGERKHYMDHQKVTLGLLNYFSTSCQNMHKPFQTIEENKLTYMVNNQYFIYGIIKPNKMHKMQLRKYDICIKNNFEKYYRKGRTYIKIWRSINFNAYTLVFVLRVFLHKITELKNK